VLGTLVAYQGGSSFIGAEAQEARDKLQPGVLEALATGGTFWVLLHEEANLAPAVELRGDVERGAFVYDRLNEVANRSQAELRQWLADRGVSFKPYWIVNAIRVTGDQSLALDIAARPEVKAIYPTKVYQLPPTTPGATEARINAIEWGISRIRAPKVWNQLGVRGENIVVANVDTGVQFNHPALVNQYRGNLGGGTFNHNFQWKDPSNICGSPSLAPCDNNNHGTHTMGTMVGDDGNPGPNQIGVAPKAKWIACKGCESSFCSDAALLSCGQWILAPTDLNGNNPNPALRPHVVNNSWGGGGGDPFYASTVNAWVSSGIFPAFSNGNSGPGCSTSGSPGDFVNTYSAGAFSITNAIASFSSRGPSSFGPGEIKPNIAAPGVSVRSSIANPPNGYGSLSGTSMASPHVSGTVALMWSHSTTITRNISATRALLDSTARNVSNLTCGGTAADNNVWGEGMLNAFGATNGAPQPITEEPEQ
jgi:subtilisin family serine protease